MICYAEEYRRRFEAEGEQKLYQQEKLLFDATELISRAMRTEGVTKAGLARRIGKTKAYVTQVLRGKHNMTLRTLAELAWALNYTVELGATNDRNSHRIYLGTWASYITSRCLPSDSPLQAAVMDLVPVLRRECEMDEVLEQVA